MFCNLFCLISKTLLEQIIEQTQHFTMRRRTEYVLDTIAKEVRDPLIISHWNSINSPTQACVKVNIMTHGYDTVRDFTKLDISIGIVYLLSLCLCPCFHLHSDLPNFVSYPCWEEVPEVYLQRWQCYEHVL